MTDETDAPEAADPAGEEAGFAAALRELLPLAIVAVVAGGAVAAASVPLLGVPVGTAIGNGLVAGVVAGAAAWLGGRAAAPQ